MGSAFVRRFTSDPGNQILLEIESINVLDLEPPAAIAGVGSGVALLVGEFDDGPYMKTLQMLDATDLQTTFGQLGYNYGSNLAQNPCAVQRSADAASVPEYWNGNGILALNGKKFASLLVCRVNTSVGAVTLTPLAFIDAVTAYATYALATGQILALNLGSGVVNSTFTGLPATVTGSAITSPTTFTGVEQLVLGADGMPNFTVFFQSGDQLIAAVTTRINQYAGFTMCTHDATTLTLTGIQGGTGGAVRVVSGTSGVLAKLGLTAATTLGTGNVVNILAVTESEVATIVAAATTNHVKVEQSAVTSLLRLSNVQTPGSGTLLIDASTTALGLGFTNGTSSVAANTPLSSLPAGTVVQNSGVTVVLVTTQTTSFGSVTPGQGGGAFSVPVRHANDNGSGLSANSGTITVIPNPPPAGAFSCLNPAPISVALTETQIDAQYALALAAGGPTTDINSVAKKANIIWSARHSNAIRSALRVNALYASANGCFGRVAPLSPPLNTRPTVSIGAASPGVGATRSDRVIYCPIGANVFVPIIGQVGLIGGPGFTATGNIDQTSDGWMATQLSQLPPEENPGQVTSFMDAINGIETGANVQGLDMSTYIAFKGAGCAALRWDDDDGVAIFQSGVTSVDPVASPGLVNISRRRMADFLQDSIASFSQGYAKRLATVLRKQALLSAITRFLDGLLSRDQPSAQRIGGYTPASNKGNAQTPTNMFRIGIDVRTLSSLDSIVPITLIGDSVNTTILPQAA